jgi:hypothetical protein
MEDSPMKMLFRSWRKFRFLSPAIYGDLAIIAFFAEMQLPRLK